MKCKNLCIEVINSFWYNTILPKKQAVDNFIARFYQLGKQVFTGFLCKKMYKNNCLNCLKIYVRIFIQCINISCRNFQTIQKTFVLYRFKSLNFSELKWKGVKCVFFIFRRYIPHGDVEKIFENFFYFFMRRFF